MVERVPAEPFVAVLMAAAEQKTATRRSMPLSVSCSHAPYQRTCPAGRTEVRSCRSSKTAHNWLISTSGGRADRQSRVPQDHRLRCGGNLIVATMATSAAFLSQICQIFHQRCLLELSSIARHLTGMPGDKLTELRINGVFSWQTASEPADLIRGIICEMRRSLHGRCMF